MSKQGPKVISSLGLRQPSVERSPATDFYDFESIHENLPKGAELHGVHKLHADGYNGEGVKIAVIDSGIDASHPDFNEKIIKQTWFRGGSKLRDDDHGTHVAGIIHYMAPEAEIYDYRVLGKDGLGVEEAICASIVEACADGCDIINIGVVSRYPSINILTAIQYAHSKSVTIVCAAGNRGDILTNERSYPALWDEVISVGAVDKKKGVPVARFSSSNPTVDYAGIGVEVLSLKPGGGYQFMSGTSMAAPHVCGFISALLTKHKGMNDKELREFLKSFVIDIGHTKGRDDETGLGFLTYLDQDEFDLFWKKSKQENKDIGSFLHRKKEIKL